MVGAGNGGEDGRDGRDGTVAVGANGANMTVDDDRRFGSTARVLGPAGMARLASARIVVVGIGGVGSWAAEGLARSGCQRLVLIDLDHIAESNINRQVHALESTLGAAKVEAMATRICEISPKAEVAAVDAFIETGTAAALVPADADFVIDACDQVRAKAALVALARDRQLPIVVCGAAGGRRDPLALAWHDLGAVTEDRLLAALRARLRRDHGFRGNFFGVEAIHAPPARIDGPGAGAGEAAREGKRAGIGGSTGHQAGAPLACAGYGSLVTVTATMGLAAAQRAIDRLTAQAQA